jgi:hypothetical protein
LSGHETTSNVSQRRLSTIGLILPTKSFKRFTATSRNHTFVLSSIFYQRTQRQLTKSSSTSKAAAPAALQIAIAALVNERRHLLLAPVANVFSSNAPPTMISTIVVLGDLVHHSLQISRVISPVLVVSNLPTEK